MGRSSPLIPHNLTPHLPPKKRPVVTLTQLLDSRDARRDRQQTLLADWPGRTLVVLTVILPGNEKRTDASLLIAREACRALTARLGDTVHHHETHDLATGFEGYWLTTLGLDEAKRLAIALEDAHPLGRLFDIDIINPQGIPLSRQHLGMAPRRCLLCGHEARYCMRNRTHTREELLARIAQIVADYVG